jgi:hypothetical protein
MLGATAATDAEPRMDPPPRDPSTGAKGSTLLRWLVACVIFAAQPRAGAEVAQERGEPR